ncbi:MAG: transglutaminase-like cysteine peptidase [Pseudomonadota bacterium]
MLPARGVLRDPNKLRRRRGARRLLLAVIGVFALGAVSAASARESALSPFLVAQKSISAPAGFAGVCAMYPWACAGRVRVGTPAVRGTANLLRVADQINSRINRTVPQITDRAQFRREEYWSLPTMRGGDCEDFALLKMKTLMQAGVPANRLMIATAFLPDRTRHAVLVLRTDHGDFVLDNLERRILPWEDTGLTFLRMQNPDRPASWDAVFAGGMIKSPRIATGSVTR